MNKLQLFAAIIFAVVFAGSVPPIRGQEPNPEAQVPAAVPLKLPVTYVHAQTPADQLQLNADNSFSLQEAGETYHGTFSVSGNTLELRISETNTNTTATMQGNNLTDSSGQTWVLREPPVHPASVADVVKNQDVIRLVIAGLDDEIVIAKIGSSKCQFDTSPEALTQLRQRGVSAAVIKAMAKMNAPPAPVGGAASTLPPAAPGHQPQAGSVDASLNSPARTSPNPPPAPVPPIQPKPRQDQSNKTAADLTPVERIYSDVKLGKTAQPQRFGDVALRLTKVNPETGTYSVEILSDDKMILVEDKRINDFVQFYTIKSGRTPYNLIINQVTNGGIAGYLWREPLMATGCRSLQALKLKDVSTCFDVKLGKTLHPQRFADITLKLESVDPKHNKYTVIVMADDKSYEKKAKNANEPVQFYTSKSGHNPYELVINQINKDQIIGYLAAPKDAPTVPPHNYFDVKLGRTLQPQHFADITLKLVSTDPEHNKYTVLVTADDKQYEERDKNANEAVQFYTSKGDHTPYELVINQITKDEIVGYLAVPKPAGSLDVLSPPGIDKNAIRSGTFHLAEERRSNGVPWRVAYDLSGTYSVKPGEVIVTLETGWARINRSQTTDTLLSALRLGVCGQISADGRFFVFPEVADARQLMLLNDVRLKEGNAFTFPSRAFRIPLPSRTPARNWLCSLLSEPNGNYYPAHDAGRPILIPPVTAGTQIRVRNDSTVDFKDIAVGTKQYGDLKAGATSDYQEWASAYRYAPVSLLAGSTAMAIHPIDYVGEPQLGQGHFTYVLAIEGDRLKIRAEKDTITNRNVISGR